MLYPVRVEYPGVGTCVCGGREDGKTSITTRSNRMQAGESALEKLDWMHNKIIKTKQAGSYW